MNAEGFIHCCRVEQIVRVANAYYKGRNDLVLLEIDENQLSSPIKWEDLINSGEQFPHVYGPIDSCAVVRQIHLKPDSQGLFTFPSNL